MNRISILIAAAAAGLLAGVLLYRGAGVRFFGGRFRQAEPAPPERDPGLGAAQSLRLQDLRDRRLADLEGRISSAKADCAALRAQTAQLPKAPAALGREEKIRKVGRLMTRMVRAGAAQNPAGNPEIQSMLAELIRLCSDLGLDLTQQTDMLAKPEFVGGLFEGILDECGVDGNDAARREWRAAVASRIQALGENPVRLRLQKAAMESLLDFYERFGTAIFDKDPAMARQMSQMSSGTSLESSQIGLQKMADLFLQDVAKAAKLDDAAKASVGPVALQWATDYAASIDEAKRTYGEGFAFGPQSTEGLPAAPDAALARIRQGLQLKARLIELESRALDDMAARVTPESAALLRSFEKTYLFRRVTTP